MLVQFLFRKYGSINVDLYDVDEYTTDIAKHIWSDYPNVNIYTKDVVFDDIDYKGDVIKFTYNEDEFVLPHKKMHLRNFGLIPLKEIFPEWKHPKTNEKIDLLIDSPHQLQVTTLPYHRPFLLELLWLYAF